MSAGMRSWHGWCFPSVMMKLAIPQWQGRVSPVFDVAGHLVIVEIDAGRVAQRQEAAFVEGEPQFQAAFLAKAGIDVLVCGAISRSLEVALSAVGIETIGQICGDIEEVLTAYMDGRLAQGEFLMPGCCGRRRHRGRRGCGGAR